MNEPSCALNGLRAFVYDFLVFWKVTIPALVRIGSYWTKCPKNDVFPLQTPLKFYKG